MLNSNIDIDHNFKPLIMTLTTKLFALMVYKPLSENLLPIDIYKELFTVP